MLSYHNMTLGGKKGALLLWLGDLAFFTVALWLTLLVRYGQWPSGKIFWLHLVPFSFIFLVWTVIFFISDLYRRQSMLLAQSLAPLVLRAQIINSLIAGLFFYLIPYFQKIGLTPRLNLLIDLIISFGLIVFWRRSLAPRLWRTRPVPVRFECEGAEVAALKEVIAREPSFNLILTEERPQLVVYDKYSGDLALKLRDLYRALFRGVSFVSVQDLYEEFFGREPLSLLTEQWFLEQISHRPKVAYDLFKRLMDLLVAGVLGLVSLVFYPPIALTIKLTDGGPVFFVDERVGKNGRPIKIYKFRSMTLEPELSARQVTPVGRWLRRTRLDELPQLWSVVAGAQSLIGPRPEKADYVALYRQEIPFYETRHLIPPGLSGWAQLYQAGHPHFTTSAEATREKLSYDLYYLKHRSLWLDLSIALKTIKTLVSRRGI